MFKFRRIAVALMVFTLMLAMFNMKHTVSADNVIDEFAGKPIIVYGSKLTDEQVEQTKRLLDSKGEDVEELEVDGTDLAKYIGGNPNANMYSSVKIIFESKGHGITTNIVTKDNITKVTEDMYKNALLTAGVEDATVEVASPVKVTGESALTGIYKAYDDVEDIELDTERMKVANEELELSTKLTDEGLSNEEVSNLITEIKSELGKNKGLSKEDIEGVIDNKLSELNLELKESDRQLLIDLFNKMKEIDIDFNKIESQLADITEGLKDKLDKVDTKGFFQRIVDFFKNLFERF